MDSVNHPSHYNWHPSGVECITIAQEFDYLDGQVIKYLWRAGKKREQGMSNDEKTLEDYEKALFYLTRKVELIKGTKDGSTRSDYRSTNRRPKTG
jgi:hypothetical protein